MLSGQQLLVGWLVPSLQTLLILFGQREAVGGLVDGGGQLGVDRAKGSVGDVPAPEGTADDHAEGVGVDLGDVGGGFDDAASDEASLLPDQLGAAEGIGEDVVIQTRDTTEPIDRDGADFHRKGQPPGGFHNRSRCLLSLSSLTPAGTLAEHLDDSVGSNGAKTVCDGTGGEFLNGLVHFLDPNVALLHRDANVGVLVEHLVDGDEVLVPFIMAARTRTTSARCGTSGW